MHTVYNLSWLLLIHAFLFMLGFKTVQDVYLGKADWHVLFTPPNFFRKYKYVVENQ
jgi:poly(A) polymerase Pap1